jgi:large subunit ribosomal protein L22
MLVKSSARLKYVSIPPKKMRIVADLVKGLPVEKALNILNFTPRIAARHIANTLKSAAANALSTEGTDHLKPEDLVIKNIVVDEAPTAKRIRFQSMGRVFRYRKRFSHLTIELQGESVAPAPKKATRTKKAAAEEGGDEAAEATPTMKKTTKKSSAKTTTKKSSTGRTSKASLAKKNVSVKTTKKTTTKKDA